MVFEIDFLLKTYLIFYETSFIIGLTVPKSSHHKLTKQIAIEYKDTEKAISEMTLYETVTVLRKLNQDDNKLKEIYKLLTASDDIVVFEDIIYYEKALEETFINPIGFFDNLSRIVLLANGIKKIAIFDFDLFTDIERINQEP